MTPIHHCGEIIWLENAKSTNSTARERISELDNLSIIAAKSQTAGRGQGTHTWYTTPGKNLTVSAVYKVASLPVAESLAISAATALSIRDYLLDEGVTARIKWPNDIWVGDKKICGILIENILNGSEVAATIAGIGLNINEEGWPEDLPNPISLKELTGVTYNIEEELVKLHKKICRRVEQLGSADGRQSLQEEFEKYLFRLPESR